MVKNKVIIVAILLLVFVNGFSKIRNPFKMPSIIMLTLDSKDKVSQKSDVKSLLNSLVLSGILNNEVAIINHQFYREGNNIKLFKIKKITDNKVILMSNGKEYELILNIEKEVKEVNEAKKTLNKEHYK